MPEREWVLLTGLVAGRTVAEMATVIGVARQHGFRLLRRAEAQLRVLEHEHARRSDRLE